jgi:hypothetical protein
MSTSEALASVQRARPGDQSLRKLGVDAPIAPLVCIRKRRARDPLTDTHMVELAALCRQARLDIAQTLPMTELRESHHAKLLDARQRSDSTVGLVATRDVLKSFQWQEVHDLSKQRLSGVHRDPPARKAGKLPNLAFRRSNRGHPQSRATYCSDDHYFRYPMKSTGQY